MVPRIHEKKIALCKVIQVSSSRNSGARQSHLYFAFFFSLLSAIRASEYQQGVIHQPRDIGKDESTLLACLPGGGGPQVGEVTRLGGVTRLSI